VPGAGAGLGKKQAVLASRLDRQRQSGMSIQAFFVRERISDRAIAPEALN
jgi:hypothetical protein